MSIILASASPRRSALLRQVGIAHRIVVADIDESPLPQESPLQTVARLAQEKAAAIARQYPEQWVLAADTIGILEGQLLGKPRDAAQALAMLSAMNGRMHEVATAVTIQKGAQCLSETHIARVYMRHSSAALLQAYVDGGEGTDKAGAYAIQGQGAVLVEKIEGDFYTVVGLPIAAVCATLHTFGIMPFARP